MHSRAAGEVHAPCRSTWLRQSRQACERSVASLSTHADSLNGALALVDQTGWEPTDTVAALLGMDQQSARTLLFALHAARNTQQEEDKAYGRRFVGLPGCRRQP